MKVKNNENMYTGQDVFIGIDNHLKNWKVSIMLENCEFKTFSQNSCAKTLSNFLERNFPGCKYYSAYEAGFSGFSTHRSLEAYGIKNIVVNAADIPTTDKERKQKEDKRDSRKIAKALRSGDLEAVYVPSCELDELRCLVRYRKTLVKEISRNKTRIKSFLHYHGVKIPLELSSASKYWSGKFTQWLETIKLTTEFSHIVLRNLLETTLQLREKLLKVTRKLREISRSENYSKKINVLRSIPGIGLIMSMTIITELFDINRFKSLDRLCSYVGLVPTTNSSGDTEKTGSITPRSNQSIRSGIIECAWIATRNDPTLALVFCELCKRMKPNEAIIRIAKKLLNRIRFVLKHEKEYECFYK